MSIASKVTKFVDDLPNTKYPKNGVGDWWRGVDERKASYVRSPRGKADLARQMLNKRRRAAMDGVTRQVESGKISIKEADRRYESYAKTYGPGGNM